ncbi:Methyltransf_7 domain-containing protein, partial [Cephalotus follicularis]
YVIQVPPDLYDEEGKSINKGSIYISDSSPSGVSRAYLKQFQEDFSLFFRSRSNELTSGGGMVLILLGRIGQDHVDRRNSFFKDKAGESYGKAVAMTVRAIQESMICHHFGEGILDTLFDDYGRVIDEEMDKEEIKPVTFVLVLKKL